MGGQQYDGENEVALDNFPRMAEESFFGPGLRAVSFQIFLTGTIHSQMPWLHKET
jgi:hypothetical protein